MNILVIYYSYEGNTAFIAQTISENLKCDIIRLKPIKEMKSRGFLKFLLGGFQVIMKKRPPLEPFNQDYGKYDYVFVGSPVWAGSFAPAIRTLFEDCHLVDKKVYFFTTSEGENKPAEEGAKQLVGRHNQWMGYHGFYHVLKNKEKAKQEAVRWLGSLNL